MDKRWRVGRSVGRTLYEQHGPKPSDDDALIGLVDTEEDAARIVEAVNALADVEHRLEIAREALEHIAVHGEHGQECRRPPQDCAVDALDSLTEEKSDYDGSSE